MLRPPSPEYKRMPQRQPHVRRDTPVSKLPRNRRARIKRMPRPAQGIANVHMATGVTECTTGTGRAQWRALHALFGPRRPPQPSNPCIKRRPKLVI